MVIMHQDECTKVPVTVNSQELNTVNQFVYLGSTVSSNLSVDRELQCRIGKAMTAFSLLCIRAWQSKHITECMKVRISKCCMVSVLLYGSETWTTYVRHERKLTAFHMCCLRSILGITWQDEVTKEMVLAWTGCKPLFQTWLKHLHRMPDGQLPKDILYSKLSDGARG